jgi:hypothetical protein
MALVRKHSQGAPHLPVLVAGARFLRTASLQPYGRQQPSLLKEQAVEEAAMPGQPACAHALPIFPRQFTLENCQSAAVSPQSSVGKL